MDNFCFYVAAISLLDLAGTLSAKMFYLHKNIWYLIITVIMFAGAGLTFALSLKYEGMAITNILWISLSIILVTLAGIFIFKESISPLQIVGLVLAAAGVILLNIKK